MLKITLQDSSRNPKGRRIVPSSNPGLITGYLEIIFEAEVTLRLTVGQSERLGVEPTVGLATGY
jgi:hypothetical protein